MFSLPDDCSLKDVVPRSGVEPAGSLLLGSRRVRVRVEPAGSLLLSPIRVRVKVRFGKEANVMLPP